MKTPSRAAALLGLAVCCLALLSPSDARSPARHGRRMQTSGTAATGDLEEFYFFHSMVEGDEDVVLLEEGPFRLTASCQTINYTSSDWNDVYYYSSHYYSSYTSSTYLGLNGTTSTSTSSRSSTGSDDYSYNYDDDRSWSDDYWQNYVYSESIAAIELTFTATDSDYLFGSPTYIQYPDEDRVVGSYEAGESRTQIIFVGRDGGYSQDSTLQSISGSYITTNGANTIGAHKSLTRWYPYDDGNSFPEGVDCMVAGLISYTTS